MNVRKFVEKQKLPLDVTRRFNCPACGGKNTLSVTRTLDGTKFFCFKASCHTKGVLNGKLSADELTSILERKKVEHKFEGFEIPEYWTYAHTNPDTMKYLERYNILSVYEDKDISVRYDPKQDRHIFIWYQDGTPVGACGRANRPIKPKWYNYTDTEVPYIVGADTEAAVLVEDCVSAAAAYRALGGLGYAGMAIIGTYFKRQYVPYLRKYKRVILALDKDASKKALDIQRIMQYYVDTEVVLLERDIKYLTNEEIKDLV